MSFDSGNKPADELDLLVGSTVAGKYHVDRLIGRGGMGAVFQATNAAIGKRVALKFLGAETSRDGDAATRFQREAEAASLAESPHIVQIFDSGRSERGLPFLVMELLTGEDLRARLRREARLAPEAAVHIGVQVLKALKQAHAAGIVHRDLKPDNVFLCRRDDEPSFVKIVDFGISKLQRTGVDTLTHEGAVLGTAYYMSPEQAQSFPDIDGRTDLFSVGAILFEMLTGTPPHTAPTYEAVLIAICTKDAADVRSRAPDVPEKLSRVVARALRRDRDERYGSASEMLADLEAALRESRELSAKTRTTTSAWVDSRPGGGKPERFRTAVFALVAALGGFALAAYFVARGSVGAKVEERPRPAPPAATFAAAPVFPTAANAAPSAPVSAAASARSTSQLAAPKSREASKPLAKKPAPPPAATGVAGGLGLSTREP
jgi:eukaryotic-like serine/threonine-protein kinase